MRNRIIHYQTDLDTQSCLCGESILISAMLVANLPCSHLLFLGMDFPNLEAIKLNNIIPNKLKFDYDIIDSHQIETNYDYFENVRKYTSKVIRHNSYHNKKKDIEKYVLQKLPFTVIPIKFVLGYPNEIFKVINDVIL